MHHAIVIISNYAQFNCITDNNHFRRSLRRESLLKTVFIIFMRSPDLPIIKFFDYTAL